MRPFIPRSMKNLVTISTVALFATVFTASSYAGTEPGYSHDSSAKTVNTDWMGALRDGTRLSELSVPGTHDTMALHWGDSVQTQSMPLDVQLTSGIRALDIRLMFISDVLMVCHGIAFQYDSFDHVMQTTTSFLAAHPGETIIMRVGLATDTGLNKSTFDETWKRYWNVYKGNFLKYSGDNPRLGQMRGKIVLLQDFAGDQYGIDYDTLSAQDSYTLTTNWELYHKWELVKSKLTSTNTVPSVCNSNNPCPVMINYLSASGGSFPYFVASGKSSPGTDASRLPTGKTTPGFSGWPDFPRVACLGSLCTIAFEGTNNLTYEWLKEETRSRVGLVMADFPGPGLIEQIIQVNNRFRN